MELNLKGKTVRSPKIGMKKCRGLSAPSMVLFFPLSIPGNRLQGNGGGEKPGEPSKNQ